MRRFFTVMAVTSTILACAGACRAEVTFSGDSVLSGRAANDICPSGDTCTTTTRTIQEGLAPDNALIQLIQNAMGTQWTVRAGPAPITGQVHVGTYNPLVCEAPWRAGLPVQDGGIPAGRHHCLHGADIDMWYVPEAGPHDGDTVPGGTLSGCYYWVQVYECKGGLCGRPFTGVYLDNLDSTTSPYYPKRWHDMYSELKDEPIGGCYLQWTQAPDGKWYYSLSGDNCGSDACPRPCDWEMDFRSYIVFGSTGGTSGGELDIYNGVSWSFEATCVPEPSSIVFLCSMAVALVAWAWRRQKQEKVGRP